MYKHKLITLICSTIISTCVSFVSGILIKKFIQSPKLKGHRFCPLAITGNIGSGKTTCCNFLRENGFHIIDADVISRQVMQPNKPAYRQIVKIFGDSVLSEDLTINRNSLRKVIFDDSRERKKLNRITHYYIIKEMIWQIFKHRVLHFSDKIIVDASLLFETHLDFLCCPIITIAAEYDIQFKRILFRDRESHPDTIHYIISSQSSLEYKSERSDVIITNNSTILDFETKIRSFFLRNYKINLTIICKNQQKYLK